MSGEPAPVERSESKGDEEDPVLVSLAAHSGHAVACAEVHAGTWSERAERFAASLLVPSRIPDPGRGPGRDLTRLVAHGHGARGVGLNPESLTTASTRARPFRMDLRELGRRPLCRASTASGPWPRSCTRPGRGGRRASSLRPAATTEREAPRLSGRHRSCMARVGFPARRSRAGSQHLAVQVQPDDPFVVRRQARVAHEAVERARGELLREPHRFVAVIARRLREVGEARTGKVQVGEEHRNRSTVALLDDAGVHVSKSPRAHLAGQLGKALERRLLHIEAGVLRHHPIFALPREGSGSRAGHVG